MMRTTAAVAAVLASAALFACGSNPPLPASPKGPPPAGSTPPGEATAAVHETPDAPFRQQPPEPSGTIHFTPPAIESFTLSNGIGVLFVQRHDLPIVAVRVVLRAGVGDLPSVRPGLLSFLGIMLENGTKTRTALQISDEYEALGADHATSVSWDSGGGFVKALAPKLDPALAILSDVLEHPAFPQAEIERNRTRRLTYLQQMKNDPDQQALAALSASVFGRAHPYGHTFQGVEADVKAISQAELERAYAKLFVPANLSIAACGDIAPEALKTVLEARFGGWKGTSTEKPQPPAAPPAPKANAARVVLVDLPHAPQSKVWLADVGLAESSKDRIAVDVMDTILGGMFSSRINLNLREKNGFAYGAWSGFDMRHGAGPFMAGGSMHAENTGDAVRELLSEVRRMRDQPVSDKELADAKQYIVQALPAEFESVSEVTGALARLAVYGLPLDEYATLPARVEAVTAADVQRVAAQYLHPDTMKVVIVGDRASVEGQLKPLGLGPIEIRNAYGDVP